MNKEKQLAYLLRHDKSYDFDVHGWRKIDDLIDNHGYSYDELVSIVKNSEKQRFEFSDDCKYIRARQGHSIDVDVDLEQKTPPDILYHGTKKTNLENIQKKGLLKMSRKYVHLSKDIETATKVADRRKGESVILNVHAKEMHNDGYKFYYSRNNVWLVEHVPPQYIEL